MNRRNRFIVKLVSGAAMLFLITGMADGCKEEPTVWSTAPIKPVKCSEGQIVFGAWVYSERKHTNVYRIGYKILSNGKCRTRNFEYTEKEVRDQGISKISEVCITGTDAHYPQCLDFAYDR